MPNGMPTPGVLIATPEDVPGVVAEADDIEALSLKLEVLMPELLEANSSENPFSCTDIALCLRGSAPR